MASSSTTSGLLRCPKNLKECIDWVLRATGKDLNGTNNDIDNLNKALNAELGSSVKPVDLTQLVHGLCLFMGYPSCLCKPKKSVEESLKKISKELKEEVENYKCKFISIPKPSLNCSSCSPSSVVCKCCVLDCINEVQTSGCKCVKDSKNNDCSCSKDGTQRCCKDLLEKLKACLSLLNLRADMENLCSCTDVNCCVKGECAQKGSLNCTVCKTLQASSTSDYTVTGLGLLRPSPIRLAERLDKFFGNGPGPKSGCSCTCGSGKSCCCLACDNNKCAQACSCSSPQCPCASKLQPQTSQCPCKTFCSKINSIQVSSGSSLMKCCNKGNQCHCSLGSSKCSGDCCKQSDKQSLKCMILRLVKFFCGLKFDTSSDKFFKSCCEFLCVLKTCEFLWKFYGKRNLNECKECKKKGTKGGCSGPKGPGSCCAGPTPDCTSGSCSKCSECRQICDSKKFNSALEELRFAGPCGQDLYRVLKDFLECCGRLHGSLQYVENKLQKLAKCCSVQSNINGQSCTCCSSVTSPSSGNCQGCQDLLKDSKLKALLFSQYSSSYDSSKASWPDCSKPQSCCSNPSCNSCTSGSSCPAGGCCENCPKRLCAKIFLGILPCLYYGLKILHDRCQYGSGFAGWHDISVSNGNPSSDLGRFLYAWGYDLRPLISKKGSEFFPLLDSLSTLKVLEKFSTLVTEKYFTSSSSGSLSPSTVRQMLLWLYGLRFQKHFSDIVENSKSLCSPFGKSFNADAFCYYIHTCSFILPVAIISSIEESFSITSLDSEFSKFLYPSDSSALADMFFDYIRKIYIPLTFLRFQCSLDKDKAGWQNCWYGQHCKLDPLSSTSGSSGSPSGSGCTCKGHDRFLCTGASKHSGCKPASSSSGSHSSQCPHPLQRFLCHSKPNSDSESYPFHLPGIVPMGFKTENLSSPGRDGWSLYPILKVFCESGFYPLTRLLQFSLCVSRYPPETLGELYAFFKKFVPKLKSDPLGKKFAQWIEGEPGFYSGSDLKTALENLYGSHSGSSHSNDLYSLYNCDASGSSCGKYLHALTEYAYKDFIKDFVDTYVSFVCHLAPTFKEKLKEFQGKFSDCCSSSSSKCKIVECPCAHPFLYSYGFTFWSPDSLNNNSTKCSDFIAQLEKVLEENSPLGLLIKAIEEFLWSIREPFFLFILAFWAFVISYFLYVQLYKLDLFHLKSHAHFSRSFKILPSTLFSDASSKLKDLSYFSL